MVYYHICFIGQEKQIEHKIVNIFLPIIFNICCGFSKEPSQWDGSFDYPQHMLWMKNKKKKESLLHTLIYNPVLNMINAW